LPQRLPRGLPAQATGAGWPGAHLCASSVAGGYG